MILDSTNKFSASQAITATVVSTNVIDLGVGGRNIGIGEPIPLYIGVDETFDALTTLRATVQTSTDIAFSSPTQVVLTNEVALAELVAGYVFNLDRFTRGVNERYVRLNYTVTGTAPTVGTITAAVTAGNQANVC
jgi:hypothetical protein